MAFLPTRALPPVDWAIAKPYADYRAAEAAMRARAEAIAEGRASELAWLVEHEPLYTAGTSAKPEDLVDPGRFAVFETGRGGQYTYHGPGQRVVYVMLDLKARRADVRAFVAALEDWLIGALKDLGVTAVAREGRVGLWVAREGRGGREDKIAAIGIRLHRWVSYHGVAINVAPNLAHFDGIVPCGIREHGVTSLSDLGSPATMPDLDASLERSFRRVFGPLVLADGPSLRA